MNYPTNNIDIINSDIQEDKASDKPAQIFEELYQESLITEQPTTSELHNVQYKVHLKKAKIDSTFKGYKKVKNIIENQKSRINRRNSKDSSTNNNKIAKSNDKSKTITHNVVINDDIADNASANNNINNNQLKSKNKSMSSTTYPSKNALFIHNNMKKNSNSNKVNTDSRNKINDEKNPSSIINAKINSKQKSRAARSSLQPRTFYSGSRALTTHRSLTNITMNATKKMKEEATKRAILLNKKNDLQMEINQITKKNKAEIQSLKREIEKLTEENIKLNKYSNIVGPTIDPQYTNQLLQEYGELNFDYLQSIVEIRQSTQQSYEDEIETLNRINDALFTEYEKKFPGQSFRNINMKYNNNIDDEYYYTSSDSDSTSYSASIGSPDDYFTASSIDHQKRNEDNFKQKLEDERKKKESQVEKKNTEEEQNEEENQNEIQNKEEKTEKKEEKTENQNEIEDKNQNLSEEEEQKENNESKDSENQIETTKNDQVTSQNQNQNNKDSKPTNSAHSSYYSSNNSLSNNIEIIPNNNKNKIDSINTNSNSNSSSGNRKNIIKNNNKINDLNKDIFNDFNNVFSKIKPRSNSMGNLQSKVYADEDDFNNDDENHSDFSNNSSNSNRYVNSDYQDLGPEYEQGYQDVDDEIRSLPRTSSEENEVHGDKKEVKFAEIKEEPKSKPRIIDTYSDELSSDFNQNKNNNINIVHHSSSILKSENDSDYIVHFERIKKSKNPDSSTLSEVDIMDIKLPSLEVTSNPTSGSNDRFNKHRYAFNMSDDEYSSEYLRNKLEKEKLEKLKKKLLEEDEDEEDNNESQKPPEPEPEPEPEKKKRKKKKRKNIQKRNVSQFIINDVKKFIEEDNKRLKNEITNLKYQNFASNAQKVAKRKEVFDAISLKTKNNKELEISAEIIRLQNRDLVEKIKKIEGFIQDEEELIQRFIALQTQTIRNPIAEANQALQTRFSLIKKDSMKLNAGLSKSGAKSDTKSVTKMSRRSSGSSNQALNNRSLKSKEKRRSLKLYDVSEKARETFMQLEKARQNLNDTIEKAKYLLNDLEKDEEMCDKKTSSFLAEASEDAAFYIRIQIENERIESELKNVEEEALRVSRRFGGVPSGKGARRAILSLKRTMSTLVNRNQSRAMEALQSFIEAKNEQLKENEAKDDEIKTKTENNKNENQNENKNASNVDDTQKSNKTENTIKNEDENEQSNNNENENENEEDEDEDHHSYKNNSNENENEEDEDHHSYKNNSNENENENEEDEDHHSDKNNSNENENNDHHSDKRRNESDSDDDVVGDDLNRTDEDRVENECMSDVDVVDDEKVESRSNDEIVDINESDSNDNRINADEIDEEEEVLSDVENDDDDDERNENLVEEEEDTE